MSGLTQITIQSVFESLNQESFRPSEIISKYTVSEIAHIIEAILKQNGVNIDDVNSSTDIELSKLQLENMLLLTKSVITKHMMDDRSHKKVGEFKHTVRSNKPLFSQKILNTMYRLQPA